ncbi:hypothetical protein C8J56DRAFT_907314 [Mycena floridula]|nr:hypothetical protein C8J56DRAFT_907314 [Mycena floridula]
MSGSHQMFFQVETQKSSGHSSSPFFHVWASQIHHIIKTMKMDASEVVTAVPYYIVGSWGIIRPIPPLPYDFLYLWNDLYHPDPWNHWWSTDPEGQIPISNTVVEGYPSGSTQFYGTYTKHVVLILRVPRWQNIWDTQCLSQKHKLAQTQSQCLPDLGHPKKQISLHTVDMCQSSNQMMYPKSCALKDDTPDIIAGITYKSLSNKQNPVHPLASSKSSHPRFALDPTPSHLPPIPPRHFPAAASSRQRHQVNGSERKHVSPQNHSYDLFALIWCASDPTSTTSRRQRLNHPAPSMVSELESLNDDLRLFGLKDVKEYRTKITCRSASERQLATAEDVQDSKEGSKEEKILPMWGVSSVHEVREESRVFADVGFVQEMRPRIGVQYVKVTLWDSSCDHPSFHLSVDGDEAKDVKDDPEYSFPPAPAIVPLPSFITQSLTPSRWEHTALGRGDGLQHIDKFGTLDFFKWLVTGNEPLNQEVLEFILANASWNI